MSEHQQQPKPHPQRCETCEHRIPNPIGSRVCKKILVEDPEALQIGIPYFINIVGCASHSSLQHPVPTFEDGNLYSSHREWQERHDSAIERKAREGVLKTLDLWRIKRMNGMLKKDVWKGWNDETDFIESLRQHSTQAGDP